MASLEYEAPESLVKYDPPVLVEGSAEGAMTAGEGKRKELPPLDSKPASSALDEVLNSILPPREWTDGARGFLQYTSKTPASRLDVISLQEQLDARLLERQARETGICPVREDLYSQAFDELIRQITINSPERGLLVLRVRDEVRMTIDAYKTLYTSSVAFGTRKQLSAEQGMAAMEEKITTLEARKADLQNQVLELRNRVEVVEKRASERRALEEKKRKEELNFLKYQGQHLDSFLKSIRPA
eukprot:PLAT11597.1.p2 GENE.PLAT11597.1~~PLAT11597.1.p2  ORF type:complete len:262 (-),score=77.24 PLAT11597.1:216-944(-)